MGLCSKSNVCCMIDLAFHTSEADKPTSDKNERK